MRGKSSILSFQQFKHSMCIFQAHISGTNHRYNSSRKEGHFNTEHFGLFSFSANCGSSLPTLPAVGFSQVWTSLEEISTVGQNKLYHSCCGAGNIHAQRFLQYLGVSLVAFFFSLSDLVLKYKDEILYLLIKFFFELMKMVNV